MPRWPTSSPSGTRALESFLIEITANDPQARRTRRPAEPMVDVILDKAGQKGTGRWTAIAAALGVPVPTISPSAAVEARGPVGDEATEAGRRVADTRRPGEHRLRPPTSKEELDQGARRALRLEDRSLRAGPRPDQQVSADKRLGPRPRRGSPRSGSGGCIIRARFLTGHPVRRSATRDRCPTCCSTPSSSAASSRRRPGRVAQGRRGLAAEARHPGAGDGRGA